MPKEPPGRAVPSDDYIQVVDGVEYHPHEGETVWLTPEQSPRLFKSIRRFHELATELDAVQGEEDENMKRVALLDPAYDEVCTMLSQHILRWDWTDEVSRPLPQPYGDPEVIRGLGAWEINYLIGTVARGESPSERKNGSSDSAISTSATSSAETTSPSRTTRHSHTRD